MPLSKKNYIEKNITLVTFTIPKDIAKNFTQCSIVGDFNNWNPLTHKMKRKSIDDEFVLKIELPAFKTYEFKYLFNDSNWYIEDEADGLVPNIHGSQNSVLKT
ncbi:MAG TPA: isoamylase early set domain-containing protein [Melioribacteraceae bacterium]|nr:isoamylase early set domain-containing protein [Melioribacteraceae bacterium]